MRVFINGGTGFIGSHLINEIHSRNFEIISIKRKFSKTRIPLNKEPKWIFDTDKNELFNAMKKCNFYINCAAVGVSPQAANWEEVINYNINISFSLLDLAKKAGIRDLYDS